MYVVQRGVTPFSFLAVHSKNNKNWNYSFTMWKLTEMLKKKKFFFFKWVAWIIRVGEKTEVWKNNINLLILWKWSNGTIGWLLHKWNPLHCFTSCWVTLLLKEISWRESLIYVMFCVPPTVAITQTYFLNSFC